jgi:hypothetical protein
MLVRQTFYPRATPWVFVYFSYASDGVVFWKEQSSDHDFSIYVSHIAGIRAIYHQAGPVVLIFWDRVLLHSRGWPETWYVTQANFRLTIHLHQPFECWDYRHVPQYLALFKNFKEYLSFDAINLDTLITFIFTCIL